MDRYDPNVAPDPAEWNALTESERIALVDEYHRRARIRMPNRRVHAAFHAVIETQAALGDELPVRRAIERLMAGGLDRHEAVHAVGSRLANFIFDIRNDPGSPTTTPEGYNAEVEALTVESWRAYLTSDDGETNDPRPRSRPRRRLFRR
jgi:hypothetical protein